MKFTCPICASRFGVNGASLVCVRGHSFDRSRDGYYNFLLSSSSSNHGDNKEMLRARRDFLNTGAYLPLAELVSSMILKYTEGSCALLDAGCGEGYYTDIFESKLRERDNCASVSALDISKDAVRLAAKRNPNVELAVSSVYKIPAENESFDAVVSIFSPLADAEILRVLKKGGLFAMAIPDKRHLFGMKSVLYERPYENEPQPTDIEGFQLCEESKLSYPLNLDSREKISGLFKMTPYAYRTPPEAKERLLSYDKLDCMAEFIVLSYKKL